MTELSFARFEDKVALITGAAAGICRISAEIIAAEGGTIAAVDNNGELLDGAVESFAAAGGGPAPSLSRPTCFPRRTWMMSYPMSSTATARSTF